jgi:hypothetical protein
MMPRRSSGSSRADSAVEPARSQNKTVSWRRSAAAERAGNDPARGESELGAIGGAEIVGN